MRFLYRLRAGLLFAIVAVTFALVTADFAEARRGGSFGSRGMRTYSTPAPTRTAPNTVSPINRSMTQPTQPSAGNPGAAARPGTAAQPSRGGLFGGMAGGLLGGLALGGLIGMMMGHGLGGAAGFLGLILQIGIIALIAMFVMRFLRSRRSGPSYAAAGGPSVSERYERSPYEGGPFGARSEPDDAPRRGAVPGVGGRAGDAPGYDAPPADGAASAGASPGVTTVSGGDEVGITQDDLDTFERLLAEIQSAFAREDYAALRERSTPEIVSYLSEELSENAVKGRKNDVRDVELLSGDLSEAWSEGNDDYATVAMHYASIDVMRDRNTGAVLEGDPDHPTETTEIWTFRRPFGGAWKLSAIQEV